jgi:methylated-DNA-[protein]-cysteine S-methyltransferase
MSTTTVRRRTVESPIGTLVLIADDDGLTRIIFANQNLADVGLNDVDVPEADADPVLDTTATQLEEYFAGDRRTFDVPLHLIGTDFQRAAWLALAAIPYGETTSYGRQAEAIGRPGAFRAVGSANGQNPLPIVLPCHRVVGADGSLTGFGGGIDVKQRLLDLERNQQSLAI